ncbi:hypothetical protein CEXT_278001, partial [Caerostris extrusa]
GEQVLQRLIGGIDRAGLHRPCENRLGRAPRWPAVHRLELQQQLERSELVRKNWHSHVCEIVTCRIRGVHGQISNVRLSIGITSVLIMRSICPAAGPGHHHVSDIH